MAYHQLISKQYFPVTDLTFTNKRHNRAFLFSLRTLSTEPPTDRKPLSVFFFFLLAPYHFTASCTLRGKKKEKTASAKKSKP